MALNSIPRDDDHVPFVKGLQLRQCRGPDVATARVTTVEAEERTRVYAKPIDVAVMDALRWPESGATVAAQAKSMAPQCQILMLRSVDSSGAVVQVARVEAPGNLSKIVDIDRCVRAIRGVTLRDRWPSPALFGAVLCARLDVRIWVESPFFAHLSWREGHVSASRADDRRRSAITQRLTIFPDSLRTQPKPLRRLHHPPLLGALGGGLQSGP
jgi:DNA-binding NarL/FixJ family response regulator